MYRLPLSVGTATRRLVSSSLLSKPSAVLSTPKSALRRRYITMDAKELSSYLADSPPNVVRLEIAKHFEALTDKQKRYAHFISK